MMKTHTHLLGFDFGTKRIGVAYGQTVTCTGVALDPLAADNGIPNWDQIQALIQHWHIDGVVVGLPLTLEGQEQWTSHLARKFANRLHGRFQLPRYMVDERLTTVSARQDNHKKNTSIDSQAALLILESWLHQYKEPTL